MVISAMKKGSSTSVPGAVHVPQPAPVSKQRNKYGLKGRLYQNKMEAKVEAVTKAAAKRTVPAKKDSVQPRVSRPPAKVGKHL